MSGYILCAQYDARSKIEQNQICHDQQPTINDGRRNSASSASRTLYDVPEAEVGSPAAPRRLDQSFCSIGTILPSRPARGLCRRAQRRSRMARLRATASAARSVLDGREHDGRLDRVGGLTPHTPDLRAYHARLPDFSDGLRRVSPSRARRCAVCTRRSRTASAIVGSTITSCQ